MQQLSISFSWHWVRGHAGRRKQPHEFTFAETLNEAADDLATIARNGRALDHDDDHWPEQVISIIGHRGRLCGRTACELRYCCTAGDLLSYWQDRYRWNDSLVSLVDLLGTKKALSKLSPNSLQRIQKLRCGWLPVNTRVSREDPDRLSGCTACSSGNIVDETVDHIFQCPCPARRSAIIQRFSVMSANFLEWKTSPHIIHAIQSGALAWIQQREPPSVESLHLPETPLGDLISRAYIEQTTLGWNVLFRGFWSRSWRRAQEYEFAASPGKRGFKDNGEDWASRAQLWMFDLFDLVWGLRNANEHGVDPETQRMVRKARCERAIHRLYSLGVDLPHDERHPFKDSIDTLLSKSVSSQELWISKTEEFLPLARKRVKNCADNKQRSLTEFFVRRHSF
jgi:hypothetical protein